MHWLLSLDTDLFILINSRLTHPLFDRLMSGMTEQSNWYPVLAGAWIALIIWGGRRGRMAAIMLVIAVALSDQITCAFLKPVFGRLRPCNALPAEQCRLLVGASSAKSFPSAHAANSFAMATVASWGYRRLAPLFYVVAALVAYSRVYVGLTTLSTAWAEHSWAFSRAGSRYGSWRECGMCGWFARQDA